MFKQDISFEVWGGESGKYRLKDNDGSPIENTPEETCERVATALADIEPKDKQYWKDQFMTITGTKFAGGGRIMANVGAGKYKKETSPINCTVMRQIPDSLVGIMDVVKDAAITLKSGCGVGYDFSTIRPKGSHVWGAGADTSGVISFMKIFDSACSTIMSGGARRGAQMGCLDVSSPEIFDFIAEKRNDGALRYFNLSILVSDKFMQAVVDDAKWDLWFWEKVKGPVQEGVHVCKIMANDLPYNHSEYEYFSFAQEHCEVEYGNCTVSDIYKKKIHKTVDARQIWDVIMKSTYDFWEPGVIFIDRVNEENNLYFVEKIRATNPCGEQGLGPSASCLLGSMILPTYVMHPFDNNKSFDFEQLEKDVRIANILMDNVVEINNLPLESLEEEIIKTRRHGLGFTGLGSALNMLGMSYGSKESIEFVDKVFWTIAKESLMTNIALAKEKGCAPIFESLENRQLVMKSGYMKRLLNSLDNKDKVIADILKYGLRYSHATSIAPTGTMSLTWGNNCSGGIEPSIYNSYLRNVREPGKKTKTQVEIMDYAYFLWKEQHGDEALPSWWRTSEDLSVSDHLNIQAAAQKWCDSAISKTINVPQDYPFEDFKKVYLDGWKKGLKGVTTFRPNASIGAGVLTQTDTLKQIEYSFTLQDGTEVTFTGDEFVEYDGETHNVANLYDALKEGIYGKM